MVILQLAVNKLRLGYFLNKNKISVGKALRSCEMAHQQPQRAPVETEVVALGKSLPMLLSWHTRLGQGH